VDKIVARNSMITK